MSKFSRYIKRFGLIAIGGAGGFGTFFVVDRVQERKWKNQLLSTVDPNPVKNVLYLADSYKITHHTQYPPNTTNLYSYFESRGGKFPETCFFGLQYVLKRWMVGPVVNERMIAEAKQFYAAHFGGQQVFNEEGWKRIVQKHNGYLPLRIKAVPEGSVIPNRNVLFTVENTDPELPWLTNWFETLLDQVWYPTTVCTNSRYQKLLIAKYLDETSESLDGLPFKLHDFGYRGVSSVEQAGIGDAAHLVNFVGTDTVAGLQLCRQYYRCPMAGFSIPAMEHNTVTTWGREGEVEAFRNMLEKYPKGLVSVVCDSYDIFNAVENVWGKELRNLVLQRNGSGCLVIRPDSGEPKIIVVKVLDLLAKSFPITINKKGYKVLPNYLRVIQGDGIWYESLGEILECMKNAKWSAENVVFGSGGGLLQRFDRDTLKFAFKCSSATVDGKEINVFKQPITDPGKNSKKGRLTLEYRDGQYFTVEENRGSSDKDLLVTVYENGRMTKEYSLDEIRERAEIDLVKRKKKAEL